MISIALEFVLFMRRPVIFDVVSTMMEVIHLWSLYWGGSIFIVKVGKFSEATKETTGSIKKPTTNNCLFVVKKSHAIISMETVVRWVLVVLGTEWGYSKVYTQQGRVSGIDIILKSQKIANSGKLVQNLFYFM